MEFILIYDKQTFLGCFNRAFFKMFVCLSSFVSLSNGKLELIGILLTFVWDFNSSTVLSFAEYLLIFGTESCPVVSELSQTFTLTNSLQKSCYLCNLNVVSLPPTNLLLYYLYRQYLFDDNNSLVLLVSVTFLSRFF